MYKKHDEQSERIERKNAKKDKALDRRKTEINVNNWPVYGVTKNAVMHIEKATLIKSITKDTAMRLQLKESSWPLFTDMINNRLLGVFRRLYGEIVLLEFITSEEIEQQKRELLLRKAKIAHDLKEKEYKAKQLQAKNK
jgi:hypothetical protein